MSKIKILFLEQHLSTGGAPNFALKRIEALSQNPNFELFVIEYSDISWEYVVHKNKIKALIKPENFWTLGENKNEAIDIIINNKIDIVHLDEMIESIGNDYFAKKLYDNKRTWKVVETCHNIWFNPNESKKYNPDAYALCTPWHLKTFENTPSYKEVIMFPIENKVPTIEEKLSNMALLGLDTNKKHILNVGLWTKGKNQGEAIEIAKQLEKTNPEIQFHFVGNQAPNFEEYWSPIMEGIPSNVKIWGERSDVDTFMKAADVFMFNSTLECNPLVLREAISHGLKILSRNLPQYEDMYNNYIIELNDDITTSKYKLLALLEKNNNYEVNDELESYTNKLINFYNKIHNTPVMQENVINTNITKPKIIQNFICNPYLEINGGDVDINYNVKFYDNDNLIYEDNIKTNHFIKLYREYYTKWHTIVKTNDEIIYDDILDLKNKRVYIAIESSSLGDTLAWIPYIKEFKEKHNCHLIVSTFMNDLFKKVYPNIEFVEPGDKVDFIHAMYKIGWYYNDDNNINLNRVKNNFRMQPLQKTSSDILGLDYKEIKPLVDIEYLQKRKKVGIGIHSTCQAKYWNNPTGWQEVVDYLISIGYEVVLYSKENDGYMGNYQPNGVTKFEAGSIEKLMTDLTSCEFFVGLGSGLSWAAWVVGLPIVMISGFSYNYTEMNDNVYQVKADNTCSGCFNRHRLDPSDWNWCPDHKDTNRMFECSKNITSDMVIEQIKKVII